VFEVIYAEGGDPAAIVKDRGLVQVTDLAEIEAQVDRVIAENPAQVEKARANAKLAGWFTGQVMKAMGGKANPAAVDGLVKQKLGL
jgi:aspartyl-tRNA(Asn)/glutamyl-tRNA(Gln) amidotransferase subunit B